ncbi:O-antigen ligase family protein [Roseospira navarrensis]|uniref:O-antigen ligase-related domain-containing protein n=1 Tax=Roseospira navarrensis TaxID=140058 RepID=A0A7X1ZGC5_9PROT|nr:O-antigen ligase family protein [Roseospira navarrensis]MQX37096.1 hypothetical protein [Roseospira navarrensis]
MGALFLVSLFIPVGLSIGPIHLQTFRFILILFFFPALFAFFSDRTIRPSLADGLIVIHVMWASVAILVLHGVVRIEAVGIYAIEVLGAYFLARTQIRSPKAFMQAFVILLVAAAVMLPLAIFESVTNKNVFSMLLGSFSVSRGFYGVRLGYFRAQTAFDHPILHGMVFGSLLAPAMYLTYKRTRIIRSLFRALLPVSTTMFSLSSGAFTLLAVQLLAFAWDKVVKVASKWKILATLIIAGYVVVDLLSDRTPYQVAISYLSLSPGSAYNRILIWNFASDDLFRNPIFGIGFNAWDMPDWMHSNSTDNFWLVTALRYGIPGFLLLFLTLVFVIVNNVRAKVTIPYVNNFRKGYNIMMIALSFSILTVHLWNQPFVLYIFYLGAGMWFREYQRRVNRLAAARHNASLAPEPEAAAPNPV